jgi:DnaJ-class molecular chaperone
MLNFREIHEARKILGLGESASLEEIKRAYKKMVLKYHPDRCGDDRKKKCEEMFKKITRANDIIMAYCAAYRYSFRENDVEGNTADSDFHEHLKRFYDGWLGI